VTGKDTSEVIRQLVINPGSTTTKVSIFDDANELASATIEHDPAKLNSFKRTADQAPYRLEEIDKFLSDNGVDQSSLDGIASRGGITKPIPAGTYRINGEMLKDLVEAKRADHPSNLGAIIGDILSKRLDIPCFIVDPVSVDEITDVSRIAGIPECKRHSMSHALNIRATGRKSAELIGKPFEETNFIVAHMGGGVSICPVVGGRITDANNANEGGPFSPERSGSLPLAKLVELSFSGNYTVRDIKVMTTKKGGVSAYLKTNDVREVLSRINEGDEKAKTVLDAMLIQISSEICAMATTIDGNVDGIVLTGSVAFAPYARDMIGKHTSHIAPTINMAGQMEMEALALGGLRVLKSSERAKEY